MAIHATDRALDVVQFPHLLTLFTAEGFAFLTRQHVVGDIQEQSAARRADGTLETNAPPIANPTSITDDIATPWLQ